MTAEQRAAYVNAQAACVIAEVAGMQAENQQREQNGLALAYAQEDFAALIERYGIHHNAVVGLFGEQR